MRKTLLIFAMLLCAAPPVLAQVSVSIGLPHVRVGINLPVYPRLEVVPGYPVYYAPGVRSNYFFYDGAYWVFQDDEWFVSDWYNGPWDLVDRDEVPVYLLRVPVRYYRHAPRYFRSWQRDAPPRWDVRWGDEWSQRRQGWDHWDRHEAYALPPRPDYQRRYTGDRYPAPAQQPVLRNDNYRYEPHDSVVRRHYQRNDQRNDQRDNQGNDQRNRNDRVVTPNPGQGRWQGQGSPADQPLPDAAARQLPTPVPAQQQAAPQERGDEHKGDGQHGNGQRGNGRGKNHDNGDNQDDNKGDNNRHDDGH